MKHKIFKNLALLTLLIASATWVMAQGNAELELITPKTAVTKGEEFAVQIQMKNPGSENVISARAWLEYDSSVLEALSIETADSPFTLAAPGEDSVSHSEGRVKIGRSNITGGVSDVEALVATVRFRVNASHAASSSISFYDYQVSELGHTSVNIIDGGFPLNILSEEPEVLTLNVNPGGPALAPPTPPPVIEPPVVAPPVVAAGLLRPTNLRVNTGFGYVDLAWVAEPDPARVGFNIYYGKTSGQYARRKSIGNFNNYRLDGLLNGETYYLAVTAYDQFNNESDYSNEVGIIVNQPLSSTHPFEGLLGTMLAKIPVQPQNGPLVGWLIFSSTGLAATIMFGRKKKTAKI
jgi:hypothetical protein